MPYLSLQLPAQILDHKRAVNEVEIEGIQLDNLQDLIQLQYSVMQFKYVPIDALTYM